MKHCLGSLGTHQAYCLKRRDLGSTVNIDRDSGTAARQFGDRLRRKPKDHCSSDRPRLGRISYRLPSSFVLLAGSAMNRSHAARDGARQMRRARRYFDLPEFIERRGLRTRAIRRPNTEVPL